MPSQRRQRVHVSNRIASTVADLLIAKGCSIGPNRSYGDIARAIRDLEFSAGVVHEGERKQETIARYAREALNPEIVASIKLAKEARRDRSRMGHSSGLTYDRKPPTMPTHFYWSDQWRQLRYEALKDSNGCCCLCGSRPSPGKPLHVDHIKPRSLYPQLELDKSNLQVLCFDCNTGKGNRDEIDWRREDGPNF